MDIYNEIWDEFKWEEFLKEQDKIVDRFMELFYKYQSHPNRDEIIAREMGWDKYSFSDDEADDDDLLHDLLNRAEEEIDEIEFDKVPACRKSKDFAIRVMQFVQSLPDAVRMNSSVVEFVSNALIASAKVAGGTGMGYDIEELGANIAFCKRGLAASNRFLNALHEMKKKRIIDEGSYIDLIKEATDVRNTIAMYIVDLREKFRSGIM